MSDKVIGKKSDIVQKNIKLNEEAIGNKLDAN